MTKNGISTLFKGRQLLPLFCTQFLGAFNDCIFKNALILLLAFNAFKTQQDPNTLVNLCAALFIIPYFLFSALAGQLADKYEKSQLIRFIKAAEICLVGLAIVGFYLDSLPILLSSLFLIGTQATFFGPVKYSIIPQHLIESQLMAGNGIIEMGTFIAILLGTMISGVFISIPKIGVILVAATMGLTALLGFISSLFIPIAKTYEPNLKVNYFPWRESCIIIKNAFQNKVIFYSIIGISWFWFYGSIFLTQMGNYTRAVLNGNEQVTTLLLTAFSVGIGIGSLLVAKLSRHKAEMGLVLLGAIGLILFAFDFSIAKSIKSIDSLDALQFMHYPQNWRILMDGILMGVFGGIYVVPLYTLIQQQSAAKERSRIIAANNIINAIFMTGSSVMAIVCFKFDMSIPQVFRITAFLTAIVTLAIINKVPQFLKDFLSWLHHARRQ